MNLKKKNPSQASLQDKQVSDRYSLVESNPPVVMELVEFWKVEGLTRPDEYLYDDSGARSEIINTATVN